MSVDYHHKYLKYKSKYFELKDESMVGGKKDRKGPDESATLFKVGTKKTGNDGNKWIIVENKKGINRWQLYKKVSKNISNNQSKSKKSSSKKSSDDDSETIDITTFTVNRNNSEIVPKVGKHIKFTLSEDGMLYLKLSSKYVPSADGEVIHEHLNKLRISYDPGHDESYKSIYFQFVKSNVHYMIDITLDKRNKQQSEQIVSLLKKYKKKSEYNMDSLPVTREHHYGTLVLFNVNLIKKLKKGTKYYIVWGQNWDEDYTGNHSIAVLEYEGVGEQFWDIVGIFKDSGFKGQIYNADGSYMEGSVLRNDGYVSTGSGSDPVHLVKEWRKGFTPPKGLPKAQLFK